MRRKFAQLAAEIIQKVSISANGFAGDSEGCMEPVRRCDLVSGFLAKEFILRTLDRPDLFLGGVAKHNFSEVRDVERLQAGSLPRQATRPSNRRGPAKDKASSQDRGTYGD